MMSDLSVPVVSMPPFDVGNAIDGGPWTRYQKLVLAITCLCFITDGLANQVLAIAIPALSKDWGVSKQAFASVAAVSVIGIAIGTAIGGILGDRLGRRPILIASALIFAIATMAIALVHTIGTLLSLRLLDGIGIGGVVPSALSLIAEVTPLRRRARAISIALISVAVGGLVCGLVGSFLLPTAGWQSLFVVNGTVALASAAILLALPESPRYLVRHIKRRAELVEVLRRMGIIAGADATLSDSSQPPRTPREPVTLLFQRPYLFATIGLWGAFVFGYLTVFTALTWIPSLLAERGFTLAISSASLSAWSIGGIVGALLGSLMIERMGSRAALLSLVLIGAAGTMGLALFPLDPHDSALPFLAGVAFVGICLSGYAGCLYALAAHVYPPAMRATGLAASGMVGRSGSVLSSFAAVVFLGMGPKAFFIFAGGAAFISGAFLLLIPIHIPEEARKTRG